jgi:hypothetical protein
MSSETPRDVPSAITANWETLLSEPTAPWLRFWVADADETYTGIWQARRALLGKNYFIGAARGAEMRTRVGVFQQFATLMQFPRHFGGSWNAFNDCINDLDWLCASGYAIIVLDAVHVCTNADPDEFSLLLTRLADAALDWATPNELREPAPFHVLLHAAPSDAPLLQQRIRQAGHDAPTVPSLAGAHVSSSTDPSST